MKKKRMDIYSVKDQMEKYNITFLYIKLIYNR